MNFYETCCRSARKTLRKKGKREMTTVQRCIQDLEMVRLSLDEIESVVNQILDDCCDSLHSNDEDIIRSIEYKGRKIIGILKGRLYEN